MMNNFFNIEYIGKNNNLFKELNIEKSEYYKYLSTKPIINLDFKSLKSSNYDGIYGMFKEMIREKNNNAGVIIEFKITKEDMEIKAQEALSQIEKKEYFEELMKNDVKTIYKYAIIFKGKRCIVRED